MRSSGLGELVAYYRLYFLSADGRISDVVELHCDTDRDALAEAESRREGRPTELWNEQRFVALLGQPTSSPPADVSR